MPALVTQSLAFLAEITAWILVGGSIGALVFVTTQITRRLPKIEGWALIGKRPWGCDVCMAFWTTLLWSGLLFYSIERHVLAETAPIALGIAAIFAAGIGMAVGLALLEWSSSLPPPGGPPMPGPTDDRN